MIELTTFGTTELRRDGIDVRSVLSQPKRLALLVYLRVAAAGGFVARERLLGLFWPESEPERARNALRQSLHFLRRSLGERIVESRSEREVGIAAAILACDAAAFREALEAGRLEEALAFYRGEFLPGFFVEDAPELERWIDDRRAEFSRLAVRAAWTLCEREEARGELAAAVLWARRALSIDPLEEGGARRLMGLLARTGHRAGALEVYRELERRLAQELELEPSSATVRLADEIRSQAEPPAPAPPLAASPVAVAPLPADAPPAPRAEMPAPSEAAPPTPAAEVTAAPAEPSSAVPAHAATVPRRGLPHLVLAAAAVIVLLLAGWFAVARRAEPPFAAPETPPSIAVMPFLDMSDDGQNAYFSDGIAEELLNVLARVPGLKVAARTSSFAFRGKDVAIDSIARALHITHVLEGSVRTAGRRVRITAQLIEARSGFHLWSETYDRELGDIFAVQDEISAAIAKQLQIELAGNFWGASARETEDAEAYRMLLRALHTFRTPSPENYATSAMLLAEALRRDPGYARAQGALANVLLWQATLGWGPAESAYARADLLARRALEVAEVPEAHLALARLAEVRAWDPDSADRHFRRALELNPSDARALQYRALFLARANRGDEAVALARRATELDPLHPGAWVNYANVLSTLGREAEALTAMERARVVAPNDLIVLTNLANQYGNVGRIDDALKTAASALELDSTNLNLLGLRVHLLFRAGRTGEARAGLAALEKLPEFPRFRLATLYEDTKESDRVLDLLEESAARREDELSRIRAPDMFRGIRHHPRFLKLLESLESGKR